VELSKTFDPKQAEHRWANLWVERGYFTADPQRGGPVFAIVIPPPNVTGQLHLGHALNVTLHDVIVRTRRMQGYNTLWLPGTDHAGIATQNVVERELAKEGLNRHQLGREAFVARVWQWRETYGRRILEQLKRLGASCDWSRERFTLDDGLSRAVAEVFVRLYHEGLIYRARRMINWCPRCETALSDLEVDHKQTSGHLWHIRYPLTDGSGAIVVATTRPETMLGDTAVAVHPNDSRYAGMVGKTVRLPLIGREIPIIADTVVDEEFGTGAVKVTPAHDPVDFEIGKRHSLQEIVVIDGCGIMTEAADRYRNLSREQARKRVVEDLEREGLLDRIEAYQLTVGTCSRCDTVAEPLLSWQWFVKVEPPEGLGGPAIDAVETGRTNFHPRFWSNTYFAWMRNVHDWCVSRQLWWGHRIPAWWCERCGAFEVSIEKPERCAKCGFTGLHQDEDVLDTWFSSALWPFSTLGWPDDTAELKRYYPTSLLITGFDIIFFWVARMMMMGLHFMRDVPFRDVYITPLVRDQFGKKMTKSRGNVVDPLEIIDRFGTDAVRFTLAQLTVQGRDLILSDDRLSASRAFANKVWNAARFVLMNLDESAKPLLPVASENLGLAERWILTRVDEAIAAVTRAIDAYEFNSAAMAVYQSIWHEYCDWYIELAKEPLRSDGEQRAATRYVLVHGLDRLLRLLHPFMPFISEEIWQAIRPYLGDSADSEHLAVAKFPKPAAQKWLTSNESAGMGRCVEATGALNSLRALVGFPPGARVRAALIADCVRIDEFESWAPFAAVMAKLSSFEKMVETDADSVASRFVFWAMPWGRVGIERPPEYDPERPRAALRKRLDEVSTHLARHRDRLANADFVAKASPAVRQETEEKIAELEAQKNGLEQQLLQLGD
jgi:valyl-tRNA synthetase